jgi:hypothetical protein
MTKTDRTMLNAVSSGDALLRKGLWLERAPIASNVVEGALRDADGARSHMASSPRSSPPTTVRSRSP